MNANERDEKHKTDQFIIKKEEISPPLSSSQISKLFTDTTSKVTTQPSTLNRSRSTSFHQGRQSRMTTVSDYHSLPDSPAVHYLSSFAAPDDYVNQSEGIDEGDVYEHYIFGRLIGRGSFSECRILLKKEKMDLIEFAAKIVGKQDIDFDRELIIQKSLCHTNILPVLDEFDLKKKRVVVYPLARRGSLYSMLSEKGTFSEVDSRLLFRQLASAVNYLHKVKKIVHWDIKLENILMESDCKLMLADFGLAEVFDELEDGFHVHPSECKGSPLYCPPEQIDPCKKEQVFSRISRFLLGKKSDSWSMGIVLYAMIQGKLPFNESYFPRLQLSISTGSFDPLPSSTSPEIRDLLARLLTVDVIERIDTEAILRHAWFNK